MTPTETPSSLMWQRVCECEQPKPHMCQRGICSVCRSRIEVVQE